MGSLANHCAGVRHTAMKYLLIHFGRVPTRSDHRELPPSCSLPGGTIGRRPTAMTVDDRRAFHLGILVQVAERRGVVLGRFGTILELG